MTDGDLLRILEMWDNGATYGQIARVFGVTRNAVAGVIGRTVNSVDPSHHDQTMPRGWWRDGLGARTE